MHFSLLFFLCTISSYSQEVISFVKTDSLSLSANAFYGVDDFENLYYTQENTFIKQHKDKRASYNNILLSDITSADILNPLRITLLYRKFNTVVILDNNLNTFQEINFSLNNSFKNVQFATTGNAQNIWLFNSNTQQLELYNYKDNRSTNIGFPIQEQVIDMKSNYNFCYLLTDKHLYQYNSYGSLIDKIECVNCTQIVINKNTVLVTSQKQLYLFKDHSLTLLSIEVDNFPEYVFLNRDNLYIYEAKKQLKIYSKQNNK